LNKKKKKNRKEKKTKEKSAREDKSSFEKTGSLRKTSEVRTSNLDSYLNASITKRRIELALSQFANGGARVADQFATNKNNWNSTLKIKKKNG
jgi:hypothetical protein